MKLNDGGSTSKFLFTQPFFVKESFGVKTITQSVSLFTCFDLTTSNILLVLVLEIPFIPSSPHPSITTTLEFPKIVICDVEQMNNLIHTCLSVLINSIPECCNEKKEQSLEVREIVLDVLRNMSLRNKTLAIMFLKKYLKSVAVFTVEDTQFFISIMHTMSIIYKELPSWINSKEEENVLSRFQLIVTNFFINVPVDRMQFDNLQDLQRLINHTCDILFYQTKNCEEYFYNRDLIYQLCEMLKLLLDAADYTVDAVMGLKLLLDFYHPDIFILMKYLIISELEAASQLTHEVMDKSPSWNKIHTELMVKLDNLSLAADSATLENQLECVSSYFMLARQVEFGFTLRHQLRHGLNQKTCNCLSIKNLPDSPQLMKFDNWNYRHISLAFFKNLKDLSQKLLDLLANQPFINAVTVACTIDIFSIILQFSTNSTLTVEEKQILLAIVASPFYKTINCDELTYTMANLPQKFKLFFDGSKHEQFLNKMKSDSLVQLVQLNLNSISPQCWQLMNRIIINIMKDSNSEVKVALLQNYQSLLINNSDNMQLCVTLYQKLLANKKEGCMLLEPMNDILCLSGGNVVILKIPSQENSFRHFIVCNDCELSRTKYQQDQTIYRLMAFIKDTKGHLISSNPIQLPIENFTFDIQPWLTQPKEVIIELIEKIPALLNHCKSFKNWIENDKGKVLSNAIFVKDDTILEQLESCLKDIIRNIQKSDIEEASKKAILDNLFLQLLEITKTTAYENDNKNLLQSLTVKLTFIFATSIVNENMMVKCLKIFLMFIIQNNSQIMGEASLLAMDMARRNKISLTQLFNWHSTFIWRHVSCLIVRNLLLYKVQIAGSLTNVREALFLIFLC